MSSLPPDFSFDDLPPNTIVPSPANEDLFIPYFNRLYEEIALAVNQRDFTFFTIAISDTDVNIPNMGNFGAYIICISGTSGGLPCLTSSLCKTDYNTIGKVTNIQSEVGTVAPWIGASLMISSNTRNFQVRHSVANTTGNFNIRFIGTH